MKPLRNILLLLAYIIAIVSIIISFVLYTKIIWIPLLALICVGIGFAIVKTERRHSKGPAIVSVLALIISFAVPYIFSNDRTVVDDKFEKETQISEQESIEEIENLVESGVIDLKEEESDKTTNENPITESSEETIVIDETNTSLNETTIDETTVEERGLAAPVITD